MIKTIWFDLGNVILDFDFMPAFRKISRYTTWSVPRIRHYFNTRPALEAALDEGRMPARKLYRKLCMELELQGLTFESFKSIWNNIFKKNVRVVALISALKRNGYRLILISNTNKLHCDYLQKRYNVFRLFDHIILSYLVKCRKPKQRIYRLALSLSKAKPNEIMYTDDRTELTQAARQNHGVHAYTFKSSSGLIKALRKLHVKIKR